MALPAILWDTRPPSVGDYDSGGHPRVWRSLNFLCGLLTIESSWGVSINVTRASHILIDLPIDREAAGIWKLAYQEVFLGQHNIKVLGAETFWIDEAMGKNKKTGINLIPEQNA